MVNRTADILSIFSEKKFRNLGCPDGRAQVGLRALAEDALMLQALWRVAGDDDVSDLKQNRKLDNIW
jgi:hypothetical protein